MKDRAKYAGFAEFLRSKRTEKYRSAREFCARVKTGVSYPQYSRYEAGEQLPSLAQALAIGESLDIPVLEATLEWNLAQLEKPDSAREIAELLAAIRQGGSPSVEPRAPKTAPVALDDVIVFNRSHRDLFMKDPVYRHVFTYINAFSPYEEITSEKISKALKIPLKRTETMLENLLNLGVVLREGDSFSAAKRNFYFPDDQDFFELRQQNLRHDLERVLGSISHSDLIEKRAYRGLLTRELTGSQLNWVMGQLDSLVGKIVELPESSSARTIYSVCAVVGECFSR